MKDVSYFEDSTDWRRSIGKGVLKIHFREKKGTGHTVCERNTGKCKIHFDNHNPHERFFAHIWEDSPEFLIHTAGVLIASMVFGGLFTSLKMKK